MTKQLWNHLSHNGVYFPPPYNPLPDNIKVLYEGKPVQLSLEQEEAAYLFSKYVDTNYFKDHIFRRNFWNDWKQLLGQGSIIKEFTKVDFSQIYEYIKKQRELKSNLSKEDKLAIKSAKDKLQEPYKTCKIDGIEQPIGNFMIEPPDLFKGRGKHPKSGCIKKRIDPKDVTINISQDEKVPVPNVKGSWGKVIEDKSVMWIACWKDIISGKMKYVFIGQDSKIRMSKDTQKFELARKLKSKIKKIRYLYMSDLLSTDTSTKQLACAVYLVDLLALRIGNEKGEDEAETVGVVSLKVKNVGLPDVADDCVLKLDFLGKDSVRYQRSICIDKMVCENIKKFKQDKNPEDDLFDLIDANDVNKYLQSMMKHLTAKVFRTYNASYLFQKELNKIEKRVSEITDPKEREKLILHYYNLANKEVAQLCNHQKKVSATFKDQIQTIEENIKKLRSKKKKTAKQKQRLDELKKKRLLKIELRSLSLGTSKINYIDPRISVAFLKKYEIPIDKVFTKTLLKKFSWALDVPDTWQF